MTRVARTNAGPEVEQYLFHCPGCGYAHSVVIKAPDGWGTLSGKGGARWGFNGDLERPTFTPSILVCGSTPGRRCHSFVRGGRIEFLGDCDHELKGQTVDLGEFP